MKNREATEIFILLDRTGSMGNRWDEAVSSINAYIEELRTPQKFCRECGTQIDAPIGDYNVTLLAFDWYDGYNLDVLRESVQITEFEELGIDEVSPRGGTPLLDAVGDALKMAERRNAYRTVIVVMTDGEENSSKHMTKSKVKDMIRRAKNKHWQILFLGADFDAFANAHSVGVSWGQTISVPSYEIVPMMKTTAYYTQCYHTSGADINYSKSDRDKLNDFTSTSDSA